MRAEFIQSWDALLVSASDCPNIVLREFRHNLRSAQCDFIPNARSAEGLYEANHEYGIAIGACARSMRSPTSIADGCRR
jgi:hypothetical protein